MASRSIYSDYNFGQLARALAALGFSESRGRTDLGIPFRAFEDAASGAWTMLPDGGDDQPLEHVYLDRAERAVELRGVADAATFRRLLREAAGRESQVA